MAAIKGMILAAGLGTRMGSISAHLAKPVVPFLGVPVIEHSIAVLRSGGVKEIVVNLHHKPDSITGLLGDGSRLGVHITYSHEDPLLGTGGAIGKVRDFFEGRTFVVLNSDVLVDVNLKEVIDYHVQKGATGTLLLRADRKKAYGAVYVGRDERIRKIEGCPDIEADPKWQRYMFAGLHIIEPRWFDYPPDTEIYDSIRDVYAPMLEAGESVHGFRYHGRWIDVGSAHRLLKASAEHLVRSIVPNPSSIGVNSTVKRSALSAGTTVGNDCNLDAVLTLGRTTISDSCKLRNCIICPGTTIPEGTVARNSMFSGDGQTSLEDCH